MARQSRVFRRVKTSQKQNPSQVDQRLPIDVERCHSGAAASGDANDHCEIITPSEMIAPRLTAGVKQSDVMARLRVDAVGLAPLVAIAS